MTFQEFERRQEDRFKTRLIKFLLVLNIATGMLASWLSYSALTALDVFRNAMHQAIEATSMKGPAGY